MQSGKILITTAIALALAAPGLSPPAYAADQAAQSESAKTQTGAQSQQTAGDGDKIDIVSWGQEDLYTEAWTAEQLFDREVYGENGEEAGEVENLIIGPDGKLQALIVESGGFLDIGDTHYGCRGRTCS